MDREKVIKGLECCTNGEFCLSDCPYFKEVAMTDGRCITALQADALALLKEQEPKKVIIDLYGNYCPWCSTKISRAMGTQKLHLGTKFCPFCGQKVKWE